MGASVMPFQSTLGRAGRHEIFKNTLRVSNWGAIFSDRGVHLPAAYEKEVGRRQLFRVSNDDQLICSSDGADCVFGRKL